LRQTEKRTNGLTLFMVNHTVARRMGDPGRGMIDSLVGEREVVGTRDEERSKFVGRGEGEECVFCHRVGDGERGGRRGGGRSVRGHGSKVVKRVNKRGRES